MEQQFVPAADARDEDDGWLVMYVHDEAACSVACDEAACAADDASENETSDSRAARAARAVRRAPPAGRSA